MDPSYQQAMIQALMGQGAMPSFMSGQNATSPYGQGFMTGNMMHPTSNPLTNMVSMGSGAGMNSASPLSTSPSTMLSQPTSTFTS